MILEALGLYSMYRWFTHRCATADKQDPNTPDQIGPNKHILLPLTTAQEAEVTATVWSPGYDIDACIVDTKNCTLFREGKTYEVLGETESKDGGQFHKIKGTLAPGTYYLLLINWNQSQTAEYWYRVDWNIPE